jgi:hypothetical protein
MFVAGFRVSVPKSLYGKELRRRAGEKIVVTHYVVTTYDTFFITFYLFFCTIVLTFLSIYGIMNI